MNKKRKIIILILCAVVIIINIVGLYVGNMCYEKVCKLYIKRSDRGYDYYKSGFDYKRFESLEHYNVNIKSNFGYKIKGTYIFNPNPTKNTVIIVHGIAASRWEAMKYSDMYLDMGFNVIVYDSRYHGKSGGNDITLGFFEKYDLDNVVKWAKWISPGGKIGVHGESLGAVTALLQANMDQSERNVSFYVADCPYSDLPELFNMKLRGADRPSFELFTNFILAYGNVIALTRSGFSVYAVSPIKAIRNIKTPVMFIHGSNDTFIPASMSLDLYLEKRGPKYIYIAPGAEHAMSYSTDKAEYSAKVKQFLIENKILTSVK